MKCEKHNVVEIIIEPSDEAIDFTDFVREVLEYEMAKVGVTACFIGLERTEDKSDVNKLPRVK
jgi:hypothetical protein